ncbi:site-specific integrase [Pseudomonas tremae]|uniref:site-specific integrase n=1 Tax=Pseudomonas tremae TaxID=200454 RepID=UPI001F419366|nr:site-specific integrase [Pseudomonas tremae]MCF5747525.1 tyrosine-type recombinase/integrase [Pseudomonas tremae]UQB36481.1 site-specific integrase [Pseudomonas tremae]
MNRHNPIIHVEEWYQRTRSSQMLMTEIEFVPMRTDGRLELSDDYINLHRLNAVDKEVLEKYTDLIVLDLQAFGLLQVGEMSTTACSWRLKLFRWYRFLSPEEKQSVPLNGNKITVRYCHTKVSQLKGVTHAAGYLKGVADAFETINAEHAEAGYADPSYKTVKERTAAYGPSEKGLSVNDKVNAILGKVLNSVEDLAASNEELPFAPLLHILSQSALAKSGEKKYYKCWSAYTYICNMLVSEGCSGQEAYQRLLDPMLLARFRKYLNNLVNSRIISPSFATTQLSYVRVALKVTGSIKGMEGLRFFNAPGFSSERVTDNYKPYTPAERDIIANVIEADIAKYNSMAKPYAKSGVGQDPMKHNGKFIWAENALDSARWVFENKFDCKFDFSHANAISGYKYFFSRTLVNSGIGTRAVLESWGVIWKVDLKVIAPYVVRLAQVTGLNANSLKYLDVEDYVPRHRLSGRPCLRYWKERSSGEKEYHLDIFQADITWLTHSQSIEVKKIIDDVLALTAQLRSQASPGVKEHLFIWQSSSRKNYNAIRSLKTARADVVTDLFMEYSKAKGLVGDDGQPLSITAARLRPSFISELIEKGVPLREVQVILGHKYLSTTIDYLDQLDYNRIARDKLESELRSLQEKALHSTLKGEPASALGESLLYEQVEDSDIIFKTPLASCKNIFNPPEMIKKSIYYVPGKPCSLYNKCLACDNCMITVMNLPDIFAMRRDYLRATEVARVMDTPYGQVILDNLSLIEGIVGPGSDFSPDELREAEILSEFIDSTVVIDGVGL